MDSLPRAKKPELLTEMEIYRLSQNKIPDMRDEYLTFLFGLEKIGLELSNKNSRSPQLIFFVLDFRRDEKDISCH
jgi:hypothetical protein